MTGKYHLCPACHKKGAYLKLGSEDWWVCKYCDDWAMCNEGNDRIDCDARLELSAANPSVVYGWNERGEYQ